MIVFFTLNRFALIARIENNDVRWSVLLSAHHSFCLNRTSMRTQTLLIAVKLIICWIIGETSRPVPGCATAAADSSSNPLSCIPSISISHMWPIPVHGFILKSYGHDFDRCWSQSQFKGPSPNREDPCLVRILWSIGERGCRAPVMDWRRPGERYVSHQLWADAANDCKVGLSLGFGPVHKTSNPDLYEQVLDLFIKHPALTGWPHPTSDGYRRLEAGMPVTVLAFGSSITSSYAGCYHRDKWALRFLLSTMNLLDLSLWSPPYLLVLGHT